MIFNNHITPHSRILFALFKAGNELHSHTEPNCSVASWGPLLQYEAGGVCGGHAVVYTLIVIHLSVSRGL